MIINYHSAIIWKCNQDGQVIDFSQQDVRLDTNTPLDVRIHQNKIALRTDEILFVTKKQFQGEAFPDSN